MKLLRRGAASRRKTNDVGPGFVGGWRPAGATSSHPKLNGAPGVTSSLLDCLRSRTAAFKVTLLVVAGNLIVGVVLAVTLNSATGTSDPPTLTAAVIGTRPTEKEDPNTTLPGGQRIITKQQWKGRPAGSHLIDQDPNMLAQPTPYVIISHTASAPCFDVTECSKRCRDIQYENMGGQFPLTDIASNFLVGGDGNVYEGRGWDVSNTLAGHGGRLRGKNVVISFIGNFVHDEATEGQLNVTLNLIDLGVKLGKLTPDYKLFSHSDTDASLSPGINIFIHIKHWPHFTRFMDAST